MRIFLRQWTTILLLLLAAAAHGQTAWPTPDWAVATPESQGMDSRRLQGLVEFGAYNHMDSLVVTRHGRIVLEAYYAPFAADHLHTLNSATKGVVAALAGIAIEQGLLRGADVPLVELFPDYLKDADERKRAVTLRHLLDMTSGIEWHEPLAGVRPQSLLQMVRQGNWARFVAERPMARAPGEAFNYSSGNSHLASAIIGAAAGMRTEDFAARHLFAPIGIGRWRWSRDPSGVSTGGYGLYLQTRDMARIGLLYLHRGEWDGRQVVPRAWIDQAFNATIPMHLERSTDFRYAGSWWSIPARKVTMAVGFNRQLIVVLPEQGVVAAMTGRRNYSFGQMLDHLQGAVASDAPLPADEAAQQALAARVRRAADMPPDPESAPAPPRERITGRNWKLARNELGLQSLRLQLAGEPRFELSVRSPAGATSQIAYPLGPDGRSAAGVGPRGPALSRARWLADGSLLVETRFLEDAGTASYRLRPDGDRLAIAYDYSATGFQANFTAEAAD